jgi:redox-sensitive bicupin YhaK (pirin superfamily)
VSFDVRAGRKIWVQVASGAVEIDGQELKAGDGLAIETAGALTITGSGDERAEALVFDLAA